MVVMGEEAVGLIAGGETVGEGPLEKAWPVEL